MNGIFCAATIAGGIVLAACLAFRATAAELDNPMPKIWANEEAVMIAKTVWGEARGCNNIQKAAAA